MRIWTLALPLLPAAAAAAAFALTGRPSDGTGADRSCCARQPQALACARTGETLAGCCCRTEGGGLVCGKTGDVIAECCCAGTPKAGPPSKE